MSDTVQVDEREIYLEVEEPAAVAETADLSPAVSLPPDPRFFDVITELQAIAALARSSGDVEGRAVAAACLRAEGLLRTLRRQFMTTLVG